MAGFCSSQADMNACLLDADALASIVFHNPCVDGLEIAKRDHFSHIYGYGPSIILRNTSKNHTTMQWQYKCLEYVREYLPSFDPLFIRHQKMELAFLIIAF